MTFPINRSAHRAQPAAAPDARGGDLRGDLTQGYAR